MFLSCLTFPGHLYFSIICLASSESEILGRRYFRPSAWRRGGRAGGCHCPAPQCRHLYRDGVEAVVEVLAKRPSLTALRMFTLVAATMRTSVFLISVPPTRMYSPVSSTRSGLACVCIGSSPTSSRKMVPLLAIPKYPSLSPMAPVKDPSHVRRVRCQWFPPECFHS